MNGGVGAEERRRGGGTWRRAGVGDFLIEGERRLPIQLTALMAYVLD